MVDINEELKEKIQATHNTVEGLRDELQKPPCTSVYSNQTISVAMVKEDLREFKETVGHLYQFVRNVKFVRALPYLVLRALQDW